MKNSTIAKEFINGGVKGKTKNLFIEGNVIYSYGYHFPLCLRLNDSTGGFKFILNKSKYSMSTSRHSGYLRAIEDKKILSFVNVETLKDLIYKNLVTTDDFILLNLGGSQK